MCGAATGSGIDNLQNRKILPHAGLQHIPAEGLAEVGYAPGKSANLDPVRVDPLPSALASSAQLRSQRGSRDRS
jgi:hypothetical protein